VAAAVAVWIWAAAVAAVVSLQVVFLLPQPTIQSLLVMVEQAAVSLIVTALPNQLV
jgi:hypothetical protein